MESSSPRLALLLSLLLACFSLHSASGRNETNNLKYAFEIQGEYEGRIVLPGLPDRSGLQIVATGPQTFEAYLLDGGLPGAGWDQKGRTLYSASEYPWSGFTVSGRGNLQFTAEGSPLQLRYLKHYPGNVFVYQKGTRIGTLRKIHRESPTLGLEPPERAVVLFKNGDEHRLKNVKINPNGTLGIGSETLDKVQNMRLHVEFRTPFEPEKSGQKRGNSGVYIQRRYEVQILDSFALDLEPNRCGGLYRQKSADINMAFPPLSWQTYDIYFYAAKFDAEGKRVQKARITVVQNGVKIHDNYELLNKTGAGRKESPEPGPIWFQDHGDPVQFRNLWMVPLDDGEILTSDLNPEYGIFDDGEVAPASDPQPQNEMAQPEPDCRPLLFPRVRGLWFGH